LGTRFRDSLWGLTSGTCFWKELASGTIFRELTRFGDLLQEGTRFGMLRLLIFFFFFNQDIIDEFDEDEGKTSTEKVSDDFTQKTDLLLDYIEKTYLAEGFVETDEGKRVMAKMAEAGSSSQAVVIRIFIPKCPRADIGNIIYYLI
jgi:hypothetical protein